MKCCLMAVIEALNKSASLSIHRWVVIRVDTVWLWKQAHKFDFCLWCRFCNEMEFKVYFFASLLCEWFRAVRQFCFSRELCYFDFMVWHDPHNSHNLTAEKPWKTCKYSLFFLWATQKGVKCMNIWTTPNQIGFWNVAAARSSSLWGKCSATIQWQ